MGFYPLVFNKSPFKSSKLSFLTLIFLSLNSSLTDKKIPQ
ncbi:hypothetical protein [uncultured Gammaproteobacteria bacterium]|nr:hypothetical protein [uncultured Gammaproteobacteria bacterium]